MKIVATFWQTAASLGQKDKTKRGTYEMPSVPDVGEVVIIDDVEYVVQTRRWSPGKMFTQVAIDVAKS